MAKVVKPVSEIESAAEALEEEIAQLEGLARSTRKIPLNSDKNLIRAAAELNETLALPERVGQRLQAVAAAMMHMQERQQAALERLTSFAVEVQQRTQLFGVHMQKFAALGKAAGEVSTELAASAGDAAALEAAQTRLQDISDAARALFEVARDADFPEIAREADVIKQRMAALRKRLARPPGAGASTN